MAQPSPETGTGPPSEGSLVSGPGPHLTPLGRLVVLLAAGAALVGLDVPTSLYAALGLALVGDVVVALVWFRPVSLSAAIPEITEDGTPVRAVLRHPGLRDDVVLSVDNNARANAHPAGAEGHTAVSVQAPRRGVFGALSIHGVLVGPLGLGCCTRRWLAPLPEGHVVAPRRRAADDELATARTRSEDEIDTRSPDAADQLREYQPGDPVRTVNWSASERHGELLVRAGHAPRPHIRMAVHLGSARGPTAEAVAARAMDVGCRYLEAGCALTLDIVVVRYDDTGPDGAWPRPSPYRSPPGDPPPNAPLVRGTGPANDRAALGVLLAHAIAARSPTDEDSGRPWPGPISDGPYDVIVVPTAAEETEGSRASVAGWAGGLDRPVVRGQRPR